MSEELRITIIGFIIVLLVVLFIQLLLSKFTSLFFTVLVSLAIAVVISFLFVGLSNYSKPNAYWTSDFFKTTLKVFFSFLSLLLIIVSCKQNSIPWNKKIILIPLLIIVLYVVVNYVYQYIYDANFYYNSYSHCELVITNKSDEKPNIDNITLESNVLEVKKHLSFTTSRNKKILYKNTNATIPQQTDQIRFRYQTASKNFPFNYDLLKEKTISMQGTDILFFWLKNKKTAPIKLNIRPNNKVDLFVDGRFIETYDLNE